MRYQHETLYSPAWSVFPSGDFPSPGTPLYSTVTQCAIKFITGLSSPPGSGQASYATLVQLVAVTQCNWRKILSFWRETSQSLGTLFVDQPTNQLVTEELKYSCNKARRRQCPTNNLMEVWQNLAIFGGRSIGGAVEELLTKVVNRRMSVSQIVVFFVAPCCAAVSMIVA